MSEACFALHHGPQGSEGDSECIYFHSKHMHNKQRLFVMFCDRTAGSGANFQTNTWKHGHAESQTDGPTDMEVEMLFRYKKMCFLILDLKNDDCICMENTTINA